MNVELARLGIMFLEDLQERMANAGCNDFYWPDWLTPESRQLVWETVLATVDEPEYFSDQVPEIANEIDVLGAVIDAVKKMIEVTT